MSVFVHAQGIKTVHAGVGGRKKVVEWPFRQLERNLLMDKLFSNKKTASTNQKRGLFKIGV